MFQSKIIPEDMLTYIRENHVLLEIIVTAVVFVMLFAALRRITRIKKDMQRIGTKVKEYLDVVMAEETEEERVEETESLAEIRPIHTYQRKSEKKSVSNNPELEKSLKEQKDAQILMDVISDVF